jgi:predicted nucleotide-binding protein (sugar kinase/HSP70/actin superfamily)
MEAMEVPDVDALQYGREYGNRGQCNPTYFTVGNLIKHLTYLRDVKGLSKDEIVTDYLFLTAGACGPCRFGTYTTEYRKALRDSGFDGFRVMLFQQSGGLKQATGEESGLEMKPPFFIGMLKSLVVGDVLNALMYRIRPYEVNEGDTNKAIEECRETIMFALENNQSLTKALYKCRKRLAAVEVDRTKIKPRVAIIGEFWAMTTEGDGNYQLQKFLESEGAECDIQLVTAWILYMIWQAKYDTKERANLRGTDSAKGGLEGVDVRKKMLMLAVADKVLRATFQTFANGMGLYDYHLPNMDEMADVSHSFYDNKLRGGEGHMEVGKLILNVVKNKVSMTLSVKPFGCMPSSSVSDGVQSLITEMFPGGIFLPIETNGDGAVNVYSRVQMQLFKARQHAARQTQEQLDKYGMTMEEVQEYLRRHPRLNHAFHRSPHASGCTTADLVAEIGERRQPVKYAVTKVKNFINARKIAREKHAKLVKIANSAAQKAKAIPKRHTVDIDPEVLEAMSPQVPKGKRALPVLN